MLSVHQNMDFTLYLMGCLRCSGLRSEVEYKLCSHRYIMNRIFSISRNMLHRNFVGLFVSYKYRYKVSGLIL
jgi:hypothetical protein